MTSPGTGAAVRSVIQIGPSDRYGAKWRILGNLFALVPALAMSLMLLPVLIIADLINNPLPILLAVPIFGGYLFLNGLFNGNPFLPGRFSPQYGFFGQITLNPRRFTGVLGALDDADDFGYLRFDNGWVVFDGSAISLRVHYSDLAGANAEAIGSRALLAGKALRFDLRAPVNGCVWFRFHAREGLTVIKQRSISAALVNYARAAQLPGYTER